MILRGEAPAKINRELRVGSRGPDGYHQIRSRIVSVDLADSLEVEPGNGELSFTCSGDAPADESNLVVRAARLLAARLGIAADARIHLEKRVPSGAGLGGGSSDAATALRLLGRLWESRLPATDLAGLAAQLGSDVPFFLEGGEADIAGRGERVTPRGDAPSEELLVFLPPFRLSTAAVYAAFDGLSPEPPTLPGRLEVDTSGRFFGPNDLALAVLQTSPGMKALLDSAQEAASESAISGSGSAIVLRGARAGAEEWLGQRHPGSRLFRCRTLAREEFLRRVASPGGC